MSTPLAHGWQAWKGHRKMSANPRIGRMVPPKPSYKDKTINSSTLSTLTSRLVELDLYEEDDDPEETDLTKRRLEREWTRCVDEVLSQFLDILQCRICGVKPKDIFEVLADPEKIHPKLRKFVSDLRKLSRTPERLVKGILPGDKVWNSLYQIECYWTTLHLHPAATFDSEGKVITSYLHKKFQDRQTLLHKFAGPHPQIVEQRRRFLAQHTHLPSIIQSQTPTEPTAPKMATHEEIPTGGQSSDESLNRRAPEPAVDPNLRLQCVRKRPSSSAYPPSKRKSRNPSSTGSEDREPDPASKPRRGQVGRPSMQSTRRQTQEATPTLQPPCKVGRLREDSTPHQAQESNPTPSPGPDMQPPPAAQEHRSPRKFTIPPPGLPSVDPRTAIRDSRGLMYPDYEGSREQQTSRRSMNFTHPTTGIYAPAPRYSDYKKRQATPAPAFQSKLTSDSPRSSEATGPRGMIDRSQRQPRQAEEATKTPRQQVKRMVPPANPQTPSGSSDLGFASQLSPTQRRQSERPKGDSQMAAEAKGKETMTKGQTTRAQKKVSRPSKQPRERVWEQVGMTESDYDDYKDWVEKNHTWADMNHIMAKNTKEAKKRTRKAALEDERFYLAAKEIIEGWRADKKESEAVSEIKDSRSSRQDSTTTPADNNASGSIQNLLERAIGFDRHGNLIKRDEHIVSRPVKKLSRRERVLDGPKGARGFDLDGNLVGVDERLYRVASNQVSQPIGQSNMPSTDNKVPGRVSKATPKNKLSGPATKATTKATEDSEEPVISRRQRSDGKAIRVCKQYRKSFWENDSDFDSEGNYIVNRPLGERKPKKN